MSTGVVDGSATSVAFVIVMYNEEDTQAICKYPVMKMLMPVPPFWPSVPSHAL